MDPAKLLIDTFPPQFWYNVPSATFTALVRLHLSQFHTNSRTCTRTDIVRDSFVTAIRLRRLIATLVSVSDPNTLFVSDANRSISICNTIIADLRSIITSVAPTDPSIDPCTHYASSIDEIAYLYAPGPLLSFYPYFFVPSIDHGQYDPSYGTPAKFPESDTIQPPFIALIELPAADFHDDSLDAAPVDAALVATTPVFSLPTPLNISDPLLFSLPSPFAATEELHHIF